MTAAMKAGLDRYRAEQAAKREADLLTYREWLASTGLVTRMERKHGPTSPECQSAKERHAKRWHGVTIDTPTTTEDA